MYWAFFFFNDTATTEIYTLSLHDALPISCRNELETGARNARDATAPRCVGRTIQPGVRWPRFRRSSTGRPQRTDRKSTRLNSSHANISYAVFCLKKKTLYHSLSNIPHHHF